MKIAANHWPLAVQSHALNFPDTEHDVADISQVDPRRYPSTDLLWGSPECVNLSQSKGVSRQQWKDTIAQGLPADAAERSRATMWDIPRFAESMVGRGDPYKAIIVENVVEAVKWGPNGNGVLFDNWLRILTDLGYDYELVFLNSMFAGGGRFAGITPAPQSRDRLYVVLWLRSLGMRPNLAITPLAWCGKCEANVLSVQSWKRPDRQWGRYRAQYLYRCPNCRDALEPYTVPGAAAIDWMLPGQRIGDRAKPLADATMRRIQAGLDKHGNTPGLIVPVDRGKYWASKLARSTDEVWPTLTARSTLAAAFTPFVASIRGGGSKTKCDLVTDPLATVSANGNHHMLVTPAGFIMRNNGSKGDGGEHCTPFTETFRTLTTKGHQSLVFAGEPPNILDCEVRMLQPHEQGAAMAFAPTYRVLGDKRSKTRQYGNAVTPPASELLGTAVHEMFVRVGMADAA